MRSFAGSLVLSCGVAAGLSSEDLSQENYKDPMEGMWCTGLSASGFEQLADEGRNGRYFVPLKKEMDYFHEKGANCFRVPITWERLQSTLGSTELDLVGGFVETIDYITKDLGDYAIIVPFKGVGGGLRYNGENVEMTDFVNLWTAISKEFAQNDRVIFELYRYPEYGCHKGNCGNTQDEGFFSYGDDHYGVYAKAWFEWCQGAIDTIRTQGANNIVLVPGLKKSSCRDWSGAQFWGEELNNSTNAGNLRLFGLKDPINRTAYSVQQYFDSTLTGTATGCEGHDTYEYDYEGYAADEGCLRQTAELAKTYNKKLWLTETASFTKAQPGDATWTMCDSKMDSFLESMAASSVFLGYQVWQFGCDDCAGGSNALPQDLWTLKPYNLEWYDFEKYGITSTTTSATSSTRTTRTRTTASETSSTTPHTTTETSTTPHTTTETSTTSATTVSTKLEVVTSGASGMLPAVALAVAAVLAQLLA